MADVLSKGRVLLVLPGAREQGAIWDFIMRSFVGAVKVD